MGFKETLSSAGRAFLIAFGSSVLALSTGVLAAPDFDTTLALAVSALFASVAAGVKVLQEFVPQLSWRSLLPQPWAAWADAFTQAALGAFLVSVVGILSAPDASTWKAALTAAVVGALNAGLRALQGAVTKGESPAPDTGM